MGTSGTVPKLKKAPLPQRRTRLRTRFPKVRLSSGLGDAPAEKVSLPQLHPFPLGFMAWALSEKPIAGDPPFLFPKLS